MKEKLKTTSFWLGLSASAVLICDMLADIFNINIYSQDVERIVITICSVLILCGFVTKKTINDKDNNNKQELLDEINNKKE